MSGFLLLILGLIVGGGITFFAVCCLQVARDSRERGAAERRSSDPADR